MRLFIKIIFTCLLSVIIIPSIAFGKDPELKIGVNAAALRAFNSSYVFEHEYVPCDEFELTEANTTWKAGAVANLSFPSIDFFSLELRAGVFGFETKDANNYYYIALDHNQDVFTTTLESYLHYYNRVYYLELLAELSIDENLSLLGGLGINYMGIAEKKLGKRLLTPENVQFHDGSRDSLYYKKDLGNMNKVVPSLILGVKYEYELFDLFSICPYINYSLMLLPIDKSINWKYNSLELGMSIMVKVY